MPCVPRFGLERSAPDPVGFLDSFFFIAFSLQFVLLVLKQDDIEVNFKNMPRSDCTPN